MRSARSRSLVAWVYCTDAATPRAAKRATSLGAMHWACSMRCRVPGVAAAANASSASRLARSPMACTASAKPARSARRMSSASRAELVISTPEPSSSRAVREPSVPSMNAFTYPIRSSGVVELRGDVAGGEALGRKRLPDAERQLARIAELREQLRRPARAVLVMHAGDARRGRRRQRVAHGVERLRRARGGVGVVEAPGGLLAQDA